MENDLRTLTDDQVAALYVDEATRKVALRELTRRDRSAKDAARWAAIREEWFLGAHAQYLAAEAQTRGNLLSREGIAAGIDPWSLWSGSYQVIAKYASEELRNFWDDNQRITVAQYQRQVEQSNKAERAQYATAA